MGQVQSSTGGRIGGWVRDLNDIRDKLYIPSNKIKTKVDLRNQMVGVYDQGKLASCSSNAICSLLRLDFEPSRMFIYYHERPDKNIDRGVSPRECIKSINRNGLAAEKDCIYNPNYFNSRPSCESRSVRLRYRRLNGKSLRDIQSCLSDGNPFLFGFNIYSSFEDPLVWNPKIDQMPIPNPKKDKLLGGHVAVAVGYSDKRKCIIVRNSWGLEWGLDGHFFMPYKYITSDQCDDFWVIDTKKETHQKREPESIEILVAKPKESNNKTQCLLTDD